MAPVLQTSFWERMGLREGDRDVCIRAVEELYAGRRVEELESQGYCSFTLIVSPTSKRGRDEEKRQNFSSMLPSIVQIRPAQHSLNLNTMCAARGVYGAFAPGVRGLKCQLPGRLTAVEMEFMQGISFSRLLPRVRNLSLDMWEKQVKLVECFASFICQPSIPQPTLTLRHARADTPMEGSWMEQCSGTVGANIIPKLRKLGDELPDVALRERARETLKRLLGIAEYPVVLNHGDLIPTNVLVSEEAWEIAGVVDWAEAEWLPFGTCLYGLEYLLGYMESSSRPIFHYYEGADWLRDVFWEKLVKKRPEVKGRLRDVEVMRDVGVLLWFGYAWDEGRIDRVVNEVDDAAEVAYLRAFLGTGSR